MHTLGAAFVSCDISRRSCSFDAARSRPNRGRLDGCGFGSLWDTHAALIPTGAPAVASTIVKGTTHLCTLCTLMLCFARTAASADAVSLTARTRPRTRRSQARMQPSELRDSSIEHVALGQHLLHIVGPACHMLLGRAPRSSHLSVEPLHIFSRHDRGHVACRRRHCMQTCSKVIW